MLHCCSKFRFFVYFGNSAAKYKIGFTAISINNIFCLTQSGVHQNCMKILRVSQYFCNSISLLTDKIIHLKKMQCKKKKVTRVG